MAEKWTPQSWRKQPIRQVPEYPDQAKLKKQMGYANGKGIPFVALVGEHEMGRHMLTLKDMESGIQEELTTEEAIRHVLEAHGE